jgi:hypothetical protein
VVHKLCYEFGKGRLKGLDKECSTGDSLHGVVRESEMELNGDEGMWCIRGEA